MNDKPKEERVEDLDMPESESEDVKGGVNYSKIKWEYPPPPSADSEPGVAAKLPGKRTPPTIG